MNDAANIVELLLKKAGLHGRVAGDFVYLEDPACITRGFEDFMENAWTVLALITGGLIIGWGISMIRGAKNNIKDNMKNLVLIFGILTAVGPILNVIYGGDFFGIGCQEIKVSINNVNEILKMRAQTENADMSLYEDIDIYDSGPTSSTENTLLNMPNISIWLDDPDVRNEEEIHGSSTLQFGINNVSGAVSAYVDASAPGEIIYTMPDGTRRSYVGGSLNWRAHNPGALRVTDFTRRMGHIGATLNGFAIFPDVETGKRALITLLKTDKYQNKTIAQAIKIYAPSSDGNNPNSYAARVARYMGVSINTYLRDLSDNQLETMTRAINQIEGGRAGSIRKL